METRYCKCGNTYTREQGTNCPKCAGYEFSLVPKASIVVAAIVAAARPAKEPEDEIPPERKPKHAGSSKVGGRR